MMRADDPIYRMAVTEYLRKGTPIKMTLGRHLELKRETRDHHSTTHYIWRTQGDNKVRSRHAARDGRIFSWDNPPEGGHPGEDYGCRCIAEPLKPTPPSGGDTSGKPVEIVREQAFRLMPEARGETPEQLCRSLRSHIEYIASRIEMQLIAIERAAQALEQEIKRIEGDPALTRETLRGVFSFASLLIGITKLYRALRAAKLGIQSFVQQFRAGERVLRRPESLGEVKRAIGRVLRDIFEIDNIISAARDIWQFLRNAERISAMRLTVTSLGEDLDEHIAELEGKLEQATSLGCSGANG